MPPPIEPLLTQTLTRFATLPAAQTGTQAITTWLTQQHARCTDPNFASLFTAHINLPGITKRDYLHKHLTTQSGTILGGIRFYGQDVGKPFVEILAWTGPIDVPAWRAAIRTAWSAFNPQRFRILATNQPEFAEAEIDQTIHSGRAGDIAQHQTNPAVTLQPCDNPGTAANHVAAWYQAFAADHPTLATELHAADTTELAACHAHGTLDYIMVNNEIAGLIATETGTIDWLHGHVVIEEILSPTHRGHGHAAHAQRRLATKIATTIGPDARIIGTIHHKNHASYCTATTAGRPATLAYRFLSLT